MELSKLLDGSRSDHEVMASFEHFIEDWFTKTDESKLEPLPKVIYLGESSNE
jgi:hypothetical protein